MYRCVTKGAGFNTVIWCFNGLNRVLFFVLLCNVGDRRYDEIVLAGILLPRGVLFGVVGCAVESLEHFVVLLLSLVWSDL